LGLLKYIEEKHPEYHVVCAGSLLGVKLAKGVSFPVGKVDFLNMQPMSFSEFLTADESGGLADYIRGIEKIEAIPGAFAEPLTEKLKTYFIVGGMPEAVASWAAERNIERVDQILSAILMSYDLDFSKHPASAETQKTSLVWNSLPTQLSKENKKFIYKLIKDNARAREYESSIQWLSAAAMIYRVNRVSGPGLPIAAYDDLSSFKLYASDVGLLRRLAKLSPSTVSLGDKIFTDFKGAFAENYILAALSALFDAPLRYWSIQNPTYEVDFILQDHSRIIPIEVKSSGNVKSKGLKHFRQKYAEKTELSLRFSLHGFHYQDGILNIPLFLADQTDRLLEKI
jgi:predicted AAA+ superfamily ATPase